MLHIRVVASFVLVLLVLAAAGQWSAPLRGASALQPPPSSHSQPPAPPPQATRPGVPTAPAGAISDEATLKRNIQLNPTDLGKYFLLGMLYEKNGDLEKAEATCEAAIKAVPADKNAYLLAAGFYNRHGNFEKTMEALSRWAALQPESPVAHYTIASFYWEKAFRDKSLNAGQARTYIDSGLQAVDRALALNADYPEALTYKNMLLREQASLETDADTKKALLAEADKLRDQAFAIRAARAAAGVAVPTYPPVLLPGPPVSAGYQTGGGALGSGVYTPTTPARPAVGPDGQMAPMRVGGNIKPPTKIVDVKPVLPDEARAARVQGVVIIEATIGEDGKVREAKVLRSIPMLDEAALTAVRQWEFTPTLLNGVAVPVIMTVTVNFTLEQDWPRPRAPVTVGM